MIRSTGSCQAARTKQVAGCFFLLTFLLLGESWVRAAAPRALAAGQLPNDVRLAELKTLKGYFPFTPSATVEGWQERSETLRRQVLVSLGLWPMPTRTPLEPVVHGRVERDGYTVEKVYFQSYPGHFVCGNLYRPRQQGSTPRPGVLCPHGHWQDGRFYDVGAEKIREQLVAGEERFEIGGRSPLQARCVQLARMGCVVFHYDMVGYADSQQLPHSPGVRKRMNTPERWGYFSPQAESRLQNMMGLQTYNSICALDFLAGLPDVDAERLAVTGASGGGTQTFILCAIDPRPKVSFPAVMVSTDMQGGCTCENACYLRTGTGNIELAALFAPQPLGMTAADDWTREIATKGLPELQQLYALLGAPNHVMARPLLQFGHNYNYVSRAVMYHWLNEHLALGLEPPIVEEDYEPLSIEEMSVWNDDHPKPPAGEDYERDLLAWQTADAQRQFAALVPQDADSLAEYRNVVGSALEAIVQRTLPPAGAIEDALEEADPHDGYLQFVGLLRYAERGEELPVVVLFPQQWNSQVVIWLHGNGKAGLFNYGGEPTSQVQRLLAAGTAVMGADLMLQGEFLADETSVTVQRTVDDKGPSYYAGYTYGYNLPLFTQRVHDILSLTSWVVHHQRQSEAVHLVGTQGAGPWVAVAGALLRDHVDRVVIDTEGFRFAQVERLDDVQFLPGGARYGDLPGFLALRAPAQTLLLGETPETVKVALEAYTAAAAADALKFLAGTDDDDESSAAVGDWLIAP